ncbi:hypothetical protein [Thiolapillus sp.]|uniref:hypothetical protein n=1 Tax=Thiolapillus sp. TaxID=2017437 RepID=UPI003AF9793E
MSIFYMAVSESTGKERCKATKLGQAKREATRRFATEYGDGYIHLIEVEAADVDAGRGEAKILSSHTRYASWGNRWFRNDLILEFDTLVIVEKLK